MHVRHVMNSLSFSPATGTEAEESTRSLTATPPRLKKIMASVPIG